MSDSTEYRGRELEAMSFAENYHRWILDEFERYLGREVVEVGAGTGDLSKLLVERVRGQIYCVEPAKNLFPELLVALNGVKHAQAINSTLKPESLPGGADSVLYVNVLEHIEDDATELRAAWKIMRPGGYLLVFVPALAWLYSDADRRMGHYRRYHKGELSRVASDAGFSVHSIRYFDVAGVIPWYVYFRLLRGTMGRGSVSAYDRLVVPIMRKVEAWVTPPLGKNLLLIARKPAEGRTESNPARSS